MATVSIASRPIVTINDSPLVQSKWVAAWNPIVYTFQFTDLDDPTSYLVVYIYEYGTNTLLAQDDYTPRNGTVRIDISSKVRSYLRSIYNPDFSSGINCKEEEASINFYIKYQLNTSSTTGTIVSDETNNIYAVNAAKQIGEEYGQNMAAYVPYGIGGLITAKFLTKFEEPVLFSGYPFALSFIYSENIVGHELKLLEDFLDINGDELSDNETQLDSSQGYKVNHLQIDTPDYEVKYIDIRLSTGDVLPDMYVSEGYVESGYTEVR
jgi:hypothetical protein